MDGVVQSGVVDGAGQPVWEEAAPGPRNLDEHGVLVDVQGYQVDAEGYRLRAAGVRMQKQARRTPPALAPAGSVAVTAAECIEVPTVDFLQDAVRAALSAFSSDYVRTHPRTMDSYVAHVSAALEPWTGHGLS